MVNNRIKKLRESRDIGQKELAFDLNVTQPTVSNWELGYKDPSSKSAAKLADYFGVSIDYLLCRDVDSKGKGRGVKIPVLGCVQAGMPIEAIQDILDYEEIEPELAATGDFFALQVKGDSMEPRFTEGDVVIVRKQSDVASGDIAVVLVNGDCATVKKIVKHTNGVSLVASNPIYMPMFYTEDEIQNLPVSVLGKVIELRAKF